MADGASAFTAAFGQAREQKYADKVRKESAGAELALKMLHEKLTSPDTAISDDALPFLVNSASAFLPPEQSKLLKQHIDQWQASRNFEQQRAQLQQAERQPLGIPRIPGGTSEQEHELTLPPVPANARGMSLPPPPGLPSPDNPQAPPPNPIAVASAESTKGFNLPPVPGGGGPFTMSRDQIQQRRIGDVKGMASAIGLPTDDPYAMANFMNRHAVERPAAPKNEMMNLGPGAVVFDPRTQKPIFSNPAAESQRPTVLSPGATLLGPDNKPLFTAPDRPEKAPQLRPGVDIPLSPEVEAQRTRMNSNRALVAGLTPNQAAQAQGLATHFGNEPIIKNYNIVAEKLANVRGILSAGIGGPGDLAVVYEFMKGLDPGSVVRESEYNSAARSGNIFTGAMAQFNGLFRPEGGFLSPQVKQSFLKVIEQKMGVSRTQAKSLYDDYSRRIDNATKQPGTGKDYLTDYTALLPNTAIPPPPGSTSGTEQTSKSTGQKRHSFDGGKTWLPGPLPSQ